MNKVLGNKKAIALFTLPAFLLFFCIMILPILASSFSACRNGTDWAK